MNQNFVYLKSLARLGLYLAITAAVFFLLANLVFLFRTGDTSHSVMQNLTGKNYFDVHNDLVQSRLNVSIETRSFPDQPPGVILYQSIPAGSVINPHDKFYVVVNQPEPFLIMPRLVGYSVAAAKAQLERLTYRDNEEVYSLAIGSISSIPTNEVPPGTVIAQFPPENETVTRHDRAYLLVSAATGEENVTENLKGQNVVLVMESLNRIGKDYRLKFVEDKSLEEGQNGTVSDLVELSSGEIELKVHYNPPRFRYRNGFERVSVDLDEHGVCQGFQLDEQTGDRELFFVTKNHAADEQVDLLFYRQGAKRLQLFCGKALIYDKNFSPEDFS